MLNCLRFAFCSLLSTGSTLLSDVTSGCGVATVAADLALVSEVDLALSLTTFLLSSRSAVSGIVSWTAFFLTVLVSGVLSTATGLDALVRVIFLGFGGLVCLRVSTVIVLALRPCTVCTCVVLRWTRDTFLPLRIYSTTCIFSSCEIVSLAFLPVIPTSLRIPSISAGDFFVVSENFLTVTVSLIF